jgi:phosphoserine phosphatase
MISVIVPALNEGRTIASVVAFCRRNPRVKEIIVVDNGSIDATAERAYAAGATVLPGTMLGKGAAMLDGLQAASHEVILFMDGDLRCLTADLIDRMTLPLFRDEADFVKACFSRNNGRVTVLTARPLLKTFFPEVACFGQPLGGIVAGNRTFLQTLNFDENYGVDVGLLIDAALSGGRLSEVDIGHLEHESQPLDALGEMSIQVVRSLLRRAALHGRLAGAQLCAVDESDRRLQASVPALLNRLAGMQRLALFDMDGVLVDGRYAVSLAQRVDRSRGLRSYLDQPGMDARERTRTIGGLFAGVARSEFLAAARALPLMPGARDTVLGLRKLGYRVGIVSDSYHVGADVVRRRVYADFAIAHHMHFDNDRATGRLAFAPAMLHRRGCNQHVVCKRNVLCHLLEQFPNSSKDLIAVGDGENDICLLKSSRHSIAFHPRSEQVAAAAAYVIRAGKLTLPAEVLRICGDSSLGSHRVVA